MLYVYRYFYLSARGGCWFVVYIRRFIYKFSNLCPFDYTAVAGSGKVGPVKQVNHTSWVAIVTYHPIRLATNFMTLIPSLAFTDYGSFQWSICNGYGIPAGNAYPSGHLVPSPIVGLACAPIVETRFLELAMSLLDFSPQIPLGTFLILLLTPTDRPKSVRNRPVIELFCGVVCVVILPENSRDSLYHCKYRLSLTEI